MAVLFPSFWTVIPRGRWVRLLSGSLTLCGWGSIPLLSAEAHARVGCLPVSVCILHSFCRSRIARGLLSFPCLGYVWAALRVVWVGAPRVGAFGWFPFTCGRAVISALRAARERAPPGVWLPGVVALVAYAVSGNPVTVSVGRGCGVSLYSSAVLFAWAACVLVCARLALRAVACTCCAICFWWGVLLRALRCARLAVCLSGAPCPVACCWFVAVRFVCRLLHVVRFVSAPAPGVTWFMQVCVGVRLTATLVVVYSLLCNVRFQRLALSMGMPVVFVSVSHRHKGRWGESGARGRWRLAARRTI